nr:unnamed protein product [Spirometra erinaceieuropaei]
MLDLLINIPPADQPRRTSPDSTYQQPNNPISCPSPPAPAPSPTSSTVTKNFTTDARNPRAPPPPSVTVTSTTFATATTTAAPTPTEAVLQRLESLVFQHHKPKFWARYADDTFVVIDRDQLLTFTEHLNAVFPDIQFTMEEEENNQLVFLDVLVCRKDCGGLKTKVFRKATNTMQVLNFSSNHPISHKRSCVRTLYRRVETYCSEP